MPKPHITWISRGALGWIGKFQVAGVIYLLTTSRTRSGPSGGRYYHHSWSILPTEGSKTPLQEGSLTGDRVSDFQALVAKFEAKLKGESPNATSSTKQAATGSESMQANGN